MSKKPSLDALSWLDAGARAGYVEKFMLGETFANIRWPSLRFRLCGRLTLSIEADRGSFVQWYVEWSNGQRSSIPEDSAIALYRPIAEMEKAA